MNLRLVHRRLAVSMSLAGLLGFAGGAGFEPASAVLAAVVLVVALFWHPDRLLSVRLERLWLPLAAVLVVRAAVHVLVIRDDVVVPVVDLLLLLMAAESLRSLDAPNDIRLYALSFALLLASTAYRPGVLFLGAFVAYVVLSIPALMVGHLRRQAERHGVPDIPLDGRLLLTTSAFAGVILVVAALVFLTFPRVSRGWAGRGEAPAAAIAGFGDEVSIGDYGSRIYGNPQIVLRVEFPQGRPNDIPALHWRGRSYDHFDGVRWTRTRRLPPSSGPTRWYRERWHGRRIEQKIFAARLEVHVLFGIHPIVGIQPESDIEPLLDNAGDFIYWGSEPPAYKVFSRSGTPDPDSLRTAQGGYFPPARYYLQLPDGLDPRIRGLADSLTAGLDDDYDKAVAIRRYLRTFRYTLELPPTARESTLSWFLFERRAGHCEYFSTAMTVLLRAAGVESRNVNGFLGGEWSQFGDYLAVTQNHAHSWVEVWFPGFGWVTFDPTPSGDATTEHLEAWFWPGRIFFDAIQHRWNKWVLDYGVESQMGILSRWSGLFDHDPAAGSGGEAGGGTHTSAVWSVAVFVMIILAGLWWARRGSGGVPPEARMYLRLRDVCARAGIAVSPGLTPLALVERLGARHGRAAGPARRLVDQYLRARYGGRPLGESERRQMAAALLETKRIVRGRAGP